MRSPDDFRFSRLARGLLTLLLGVTVAACGAGAGAGDLASTGPGATVQRANGPGADFPVVIGEPYFVGNTEYVPTDTLNYDQVGYATIERGAMGYSAAHHTLPLPSYVEVTALDSGRTILVRLERRGPMTSNHVIALSPAAMAQLGGNGDTAVRVRRAVPPEEERFLLRAGQAAPMRIDTPPSLLSVLKRRLPAEGAASLAGNTREAAPDVARNRLETIAITRSAANRRQREAVVIADDDATPVEALAEARPLAPLENTSVAAREPEPAQATTPVPATDGIYVVQAGAFSTRERAQRVANVIGGQVSQSGGLFRVRTGPFATRGEAEASLANVRRAGYSDARIFTSD